MSNHVPPPYINVISTPNMDLRLSPESLIYKYMILSTTTKVFFKKLRYKNGSKMTFSDDQKLNDLELL